MCAYILGETKVMREGIMGRDMKMIRRGEDMGMMTREGETYRNDGEI